MKPSIGRIVVYRESAGEAQTADRAAGTNGTREHPAIVTRVWTDTCVNLHVFFDAHPSAARSSITLLPDLPEGVADASGNSGWRWPALPPLATVDAKPPLDAADAGAEPAEQKGHGAHSIVESVEDRLRRFLGETPHSSPTPPESPAPAAPEAVPAAAAPAPAPQPEGSGAPAVVSSEGTP